MAYMECAHLKPVSVLQLYGNMLGCDGGCNGWYHYVCMGYPVTAEFETYICPKCSTDADGTLDAALTDKDVQRHVFDLRSVPLLFAFDLRFSQPVASIGSLYSSESVYSEQVDRYIAFDSMT
eukprot:m.494518 g.494518  ORF g.494518 m.494518 type:complete len:122 (+) comp21796_c1_seq5:2654-3019(+)